MKFMVSMVSPQLIEENVRPFFTRIKKISSTQRFSDILSWFGPLMYTHGFNTFCIDEIGNKKDIIISRVNNKCLTIYYRDKLSDLGYTADLAEINLILNNVVHIQFEKFDKNSLREMFYQNLIKQRDEYSKLSEERDEIKKEITPEQISEIKAALQKKIEEQKK
jgi:hypothetical protein